MFFCNLQLMQLMLISEDLIQNDRFRKFLEVIKSTIFRLETRFLHWKREFQFRNVIFRLETRFLDWKRDFQIGNTISRLETRFLDWKRDFQFRNVIFRLETRFLDWKRGFQIRNEIFTLETRFLDLKRDLQIRNKIFNLETFRVKTRFFWQFSATVHIYCNVSKKNVKDVNLCRKGSTNDEV